MNKKISLYTKELSNLINLMAEDYSTYADKYIKVPNKIDYKIDVLEESPNIERSARLSAISKMISQHSIVKQAFDTRRIDQEHDRNPRQNLQYWSRSEPFISDTTQNKINIFSKLLRPLNELKESFGSQPEWHESYSRVLYDAINRILRVKEADLDIFEPQLAYLEQLIYARYRISMEELSKISDKDFKDILLKKDENLLKRGAFLHMTNSSEQKEKIIIKDGDNNLAQQSVINAIFGNNDFRKGGEKSVTRTITISITDTVND